MRRFALPLLTGLGLTFAVAACGSDTSGPNCGAGTHVENGVCVADNTGDTSTPTDTFNPSDTTPPTDTGTPGDTTNPNDTLVADTFVSTECTAEEAGVRELGMGCTKDCQCRQDLGLSCYDGPYLEGFSFCTKKCDGTFVDADPYACILTNSECDGYGNDQDDVYARECNTLEDCKSVSAQYTHCGVQDQKWKDGSGTTCPTPTTAASGCDAGGGANEKTCIIITAKPYSIWTQLCK